MTRRAWLVIFIVVSLLWNTAAFVNGVTPEGALTWLVGVLLPIVVGQLRRYGFKGVAGGTAKMLALVVSLLVAGIVLYLTGNLHSPADANDLAAEVGVIFTLSQLAYLAFYQALTDSMITKLVG